MNGFQAVYFWAKLGEDIESEVGDRKILSIITSTFAGTHEGSVSYFRFGIKTIASDRRDTH
jgi:hypothetical protein